MIKTALALLEEWRNYSLRESGGINELTNKFSLGYRTTQFLETVGQGVESDSNALLSGDGNGGDVGLQDGNGKCETCMYWHRIGDQCKGTCDKIVDNFIHEMHESIFFYAVDAIPYVHVGMNFGCIHYDGES